MTGPVIIDCEQNSEEWVRARLGIPTASAFHTVMAKGHRPIRPWCSASSQASGSRKDGGASKTRRDYMLKLAGEILTEEPAPNFSNAHTDRGHEMEPEARELYAFASGLDLTEVGFIRNGDTGASPDRLIGRDGGLEVKTKLPSLLIPLLLRDEFPAEHRTQVQGCLWVSEREWWDIAVYWPKLPLFVKRAYRDEAFIKTLAESVEAFNAELYEVVEKVRRYGLDEVREAA